MLLDSLAKSLVLSGKLPKTEDLLGHAAFVCLALAGMISRRDIVHKVIAPVSLLIFTLYVAALFVTLPR